MATGSGGGDNTVRLWDVKTKALLRTFTGHTSFVSDLAFTPDDKRVVSISNDNSMRIWEVDTGMELLNVSTRCEEAWTVAVSPDGKRALVGGIDSSIWLWDLENGTRMRPFVGHMAQVYSVIFSPDGKKALSGSWDRTMCLWDVESGREERTFRGHDGRVNDIAASPDWEYGYTSSHDATVKKWDLQSGQEVQTFYGHRAKIWALAISRDGNYIVSGSDDGQIMLWDTNATCDLPRWDAHANIVNAVAFIPDGRAVLTASADGTLKLWDVATLMPLRTYTGHTERVLCAAMSRDGTRAAAGGYDRTVRIWDVASGRELHVLEHPEAILALAISPDGGLLASGGYPVVRLWDLASGQLVRELQGHASIVQALAFSPNGKLLLSGCRQADLRLWDAQTGKQLRQFRGHTHWVISDAFSPDGSTAASGSWDNTIFLLHPNGKRPPRQLRGHSAMVSAVTFAPDGKDLFSIGDRTIRIWDVVSGTEVRRFDGYFNAIGLSPDGRLALAAVSETAVKLIDLDRGQRYRVFEKHLPEYSARLDGGVTDAAALEELGDWHAFRRNWRLAAANYFAARNAGRDVSALKVAQCLRAVGDTAAAEREYHAALAQNAAPSSYLSLCLAGLNEPVTTTAPTLVSVKVLFARAREVWANERYEDAVARARPGAEGASRLFPPEADELIKLQQTYAEMLLDAGQVDEAQRILQSTIDHGRHPDLVGWSNVLLGRLYQTRGETAKATAARARAALPTTASIPPAWTAEEIEEMNTVAYRLKSGGRPDAAVELLERVLATSKRLFGPTDRRVRRYELDYLDLLFGLKRFDEAERYLVESLAQAEKQKNLARHRQLLGSFVALYSSGNHPEQARQYRERLASLPPPVTTAATEFSVRPVIGRA